MGCEKGQRKILKAILLLGSVLAALKLIFVDYTLDEEYQIVMAYRSITGDVLFKQMWEPHQTSAFLCAALMWVYRAVTGTNTGVILFLRLFALGVQVLLAVGVYRALRHITERDYAFLLVLIYFNIVPKNIQSPEFSNMQAWFLTISLLLFLKYYREYGETQKKWYLIAAAGVSLSCEVLVYPTCVILFPFFLIYIWACSKKSRWRDSLILTASCGICGGIWLAAVFTGVSVEEFAQNISRLLSFDLTHDVSGMTSGKWQNYQDNFAMWAVLSAVIVAVAAVLSGILLAVRYMRAGQRAAGDSACQMADPKDRKWSGSRIFLIFTVLTVLVSELMQIYFWVFRNAGYEYPQIHLFVILIMGGASGWYAGEGKRPLIWVIAGTLTAYAAVMYISDLALFYTLPHGGFGIVCCALLLVLALKNQMGEKGRVWISVLLVGLCLCSIFGKGYTLRAGKADNTVWAVGGIMKKGPAAGILADYMCAYIYNCNYEDYHIYVEDGDRVLIVANMIMSVGTTSYLFQDVDICHFSVVDPTTYDQRLADYWQQYPEKEPNVIVVDCWYGELKEAPESWIMQYIENEFGYTSVEDGKYVRFYRK